MTSVSCAVHTCLQEDLRELRILSKVCTEYFKIQLYRLTDTIPLQ